MASISNLGLFPSLQFNFPIQSYVPTCEPPALYSPEFRAGYASGGSYQFQLPLELCTRIWWTVRHWKVNFDHSSFVDYSGGGRFEGAGGDWQIAGAGSYLSINNTNVKLYSEDAQSDFLSPNEELDLILMRNQSGDSITGTPNEGMTRSFNWDVNFTVQFYITDFETGGLVDSGSFPLFAGFNLTMGAIDYFDTSLPFFPHFVRNESKTEEDTLKATEPLWFGMSCSLTTFGGMRSFIDISGEEAFSADGSGTFKVEGLTSGWPNSKQIGATRSFAIYTGSEATITNTFSNLVIEPSEYWPYDPEDGGGPIYNTTNGRQIRKFG